MSLNRWIDKENVICTYNRILGALKKENSAICNNMEKSWENYALCNKSGTEDKYSMRLKKVKAKVIQSCLTLCNPVDYTVHGIPQARILEWVAFPFSRGSSQPRDGTQVSRIAGGFFTNWAIREDW